MINRITRIIDTFYQNRIYYYSYSLFRSLLALSLLLTFVVNDLDILFPSFAEESTHYKEIETFGFYWGEFVVGSLSLYKFLSCSVLIMVVSGFFPRITGILHFLVAFSFFRLCPVIDGGDLLHSNLALLLIPITLIDSHSNHWKFSKENLNNSYFMAIFLVFASLIKLQICVVYLNAGIAKLSVPEWIDGTVMYYWATHETFGAFGIFKSILGNILQFKIVYFVTWGVIILEIILALMLFVDKNKFLPKVIFPIAILFHLGIIFIHGIFSFALVMIASLVFYFNYTPKALLST